MYFAICRYRQAVVCSDLSHYVQHVVGLVRGVRHDIVQTWDETIPTRIAHKHFQFQDA